MNGAGKNPGIESPTLRCESDGASPPGRATCRCGLVRMQPRHDALFSGSSRLLCYSPGVGQVFPGSPLEILVRGGAVRNEHGPGAIGRGKHRSITRRASYGAEDPGQEALEINSRRPSQPLFRPFNPVHVEATDPGSRARWHDGVGCVANDHGVIPSGTAWRTDQSMDHRVGVLQRRVGSTAGTLR